MIESKVQEFSPSELYSYITRKNGRYDKRFCSDDSGAFKYLHHTDLGGLGVTDTNTRFITAFKKDLMVSMCCLKYSDVYDLWCIAFLSVDPKHQGKGYASIVADAAFKYCKEQGLVLETSSYSKDGLIKLKPLFNRLAEKYELEFVDKEGCNF